MDYKASRKIILSVVRSDDEAGAMVYCKGGALTILNLVRDSTRPKLLGSIQSDSGYTSRRVSHSRKSLAMSKIACSFLMRGYYSIAVAARYLSPGDVEILERRVHGLSSCGPQQREFLSSILADELETGLEIIGIMSFQDTCYPSVPKAISSLTRSGVHIWMFTGDEHERAISVAYKCHILNPRVKLFRLQLNPELTTLTVSSVCKFRPPSSRPIQLRCIS